MRRILIVDDDTELCMLLADFLGEEGFDVDAVHDGETGFSRATTGDYSLLILDVMLPRATGLEVLARLRTTSTIPVLMLTARGDAMDRITGLDMGADDYLPKPFNARELLARIRALHRRAHRDPGLTGVLTAAGVALDLGGRTVTSDGVPVEITSTEFGVLEALVRDAGNVVSREKLSELALGRPLAPFDRSVDVHVSNLRKKLGDNDKSPQIRTVRGVGYMLVER